MTVSVSLFSMARTRLILFSFLILWISFSRGQNLIVHEASEPDKFVTSEISRRRVEPHAVLPLRIGLKQNQHALQNAESWLMAVSDPDSDQYGSHWNRQQVIDAFHPDPETIGVVSSWLRSHGVHSYTHSENKQWFAVNVPAEKAEQMLSTQYFEDASTSTTGDGIGHEVFCERYHLPADVSEHVDFITPGVKGSGITRHKDGRERQLERFASSTPAESSGESEQHQDHQIESRSLEQTDLQNCSKMTTPACIRALYKIPLADPAQEINPNNSLGVFEATNQLYSQPSLDVFFKKFTSIPAGTAPIFDRIDHSLLPPNTTKGVNWKDVTGEGNTDLESAFPIIYPQNATVYQIANNDSRSSYGDNYFNRFLDAIDGSFCTPGQRRNYSINGTLPQCGGFKPTNVITVSYSSGELGFSKFWQQRQCLEYLKLGLQGISVFYASGDSGVGYRGPSTSSYDKMCSVPGSDGQFSPEFPSSCPWITSVGGTQISGNSSVSDPEVAAEGWYRENGQLQFGYSSGGGFSIRYNRPQYQDSAVSHYFKMSNVSWPYFSNGNYQNSTGKYNRNGRGYPDIAANGRKDTLCGWYIYEQLQCKNAGGTSISAPIVAGIFNRVVEERLRAGKNPIGFVNPVLYKNPGMFNDIRAGGNGVCGPKQGFECVPGWDPVTGLGTPNYPKLLEVFLSLP